MTADVSATAVVDDRKVGPPSAVILLGLASVLASVLLLFETGIPAHAAGYTLATVAPILAVGLFRRYDLQRRISPFYVPVPLLSRLIPLVLLLGLMAGVLHTWSLATELAS